MTELKDFQALLKSETDLLDDLHVAHQHATDEETKNKVNVLITEASGMIEYYKEQIKEAKTNITSY